MANFRTHVAGAAAPSVAAAGWLAYDHQLSLPVFAACVVCGATGGLLPDVDSESSISSRLVFSILGVSLALLGASVAYHHVEGEYQLLAAPAAALLIYLLTRYGLMGLFHALSVHRGVIHSIPMAAACGLALFHSLSLVFSVPASIVMWPGIFLSAGFVVHLLLDELFSVDLQNVRLKRSFGTALKLGTRSNLPGTFALYLANAVMAGMLFIDPLWLALSP